MTHFKSALLGLTFVAFAGGAAYAQTGMMSGGDSMSGQHMSASDMKTMKKCQGMSHDMMMKSAKCTKMMKAHPDMMNGSMSNGSMSNGSMDNGSMSNGSNGGMMTH